MRRLVHFGLCLFLLSGVTCSDYTPIDGEPIRQYASSVIRFSSQYSASDWSATQALGPENVFPQYGDWPQAWAAATADGQREFLELGFEAPQTVQVIEIFETYNPGAIDTVYLRRPGSNRWEIVYARPARTDLPRAARNFTIFLPVETDYLINAIRLAVNSPAVPGWNEIDAVALKGQRKKR